MAGRVADSSEASETSQKNPAPAEGTPPDKAKMHAAFSMHSLLQVWKTDKSDSRHLRETTNY